MPNIHLIPTFLALLFCGSAFGQFPPPPNVPPPIQDEDDTAKAIISDALNAPAASGPDKSTGNLILDDVLEIIRRKGSVLDGSALDPQVTSPTKINVGPQPVEAVEANSVYLAAEQLLRTARLLQSLPGDDDDRSQLIHAMRSQAAKLMIDAVSAETIHR